MKSIRKRGVLGWFKAVLNRAKNTPLRLRAWWRRNDTRFGYWWRIGTFAVVLAVVAGIFSAISYLHELSAYSLSPETRKLIGTTDQKLINKLSFNNEKNIYEFNKNALKATDANPFTDMEAQSGNSNNMLYALDVYRDGRKGVTYHDINSGLAFDLIPDFVSKNGKSVDGHLVYPIDNGNQAVYTLKNNGLKEDIIIHTLTSDSLSFRYAIDLPETLEMRLIPDGDGAVGVYSASPALFGDINYSNQSDREAVKKAQINSEKTYLVFGIPAPVIKDTNNHDVGNARFELKDGTLTVIATDLQNAKLPISIDPSVVVTSASDLQTDGNNLGGISFGSSSEVQRQIVGGGKLSSWSSTATLPASNTDMSATVYNGRIYTLGGSGYGSAVYSATIAGDGSLGSWTAATTMLSSRTYAGAAVNNGYLYVWGGYNTTTNSATGSVEYTKINPDGTLGEWHTSTAMTTAVCRAATASYNGFLYSFGGSTTPTAGCANTSTGVVNTVQFAPLKADGSVGNWSTTTAIAYGTSGQVMSAMAGAYNGYMYLLGGTNNGGATAYSNVQYAPINNDGTLGSWASLASLPAGYYDAGFTIANNYMYVIGDQNGTAAYRMAELYANGTISPTWYARNQPALPSGLSKGSFVINGETAYYLGGTSSDGKQVLYASIGGSGSFEELNYVSTTFTTSRERMATAVYDKCIFILGGYGSNSNIYVQYAQYSSIDDNGNITTTWPNKSFSGAGRADLAAVAYNGYLYVLGGYNGNANTYYNEVQYVPINSDCSLGTWATTTAFDTSGNARGGIQSFIYNDYIYVVGGINASGNFSSVRYAPVNSNGTIGTWSSTTALPTAMNRMQTVVSGNRLYVLGGTQLALPNPNTGATTGSRPTGAGSSTVYYTTINTDGTLNATWQSTTNLPYDAYEFGATVINGYIYMGGGFSNEIGVSSKYYVARIIGNGSLSSWSLAHDAGTGSASSALVARNGYLYRLGGRRDTGIIGGAARSSNTEYGKVFNGGGGQTGNWTTSNTLSTGRTLQSATAYDGYAYVVGGSADGGSSGRNDIEYSKLQPNGMFDTFTTDSQTFTSARTLPGTVAYNGYLYVIGGESGATKYGDVQYAPIGSSGGLSGAFATTTNFTTGSGGDTGRSGVCVTTYNGKLYTIGGWDGTTYHATTRYAQINTNGTVGSWSNAGSNFTNGRYGSGCFAVNNYLYVLGGRNSSTTYRDVQYAPINSDGTLGAWAQTTMFEGGRSNATVTYANSFVYIYGGCTTSTCSAGYADTQYAPLNADGSLGSWQQKRSTSLGYSPYLSAGFAYKGYLYQLGGAGVTPGTSTTSSTPLSATARTGKYSKFIDLGGLSRITGITYSGKLTNSVAPGKTPITFQTASTTGEFRSSRTISDINSSSTTGCSSNDPLLTRYILVTTVLDDASDSILSDYSSIFSNMESLTVQYTPTHASPDVRLKGGKTLQSGVLSALDTCYP